MVLCCTESFVSAVGIVEHDKVIPQYVKFSLINGYGYPALDSLPLIVTPAYYCCLLSADSLASRDTGVAPEGLP